MLQLAIINLFETKEKRKILAKKQEVPVLK
jgi:hypothetical protein